MAITYECNKDLAIETGRRLEYNFQRVLVYGQIDRAFFVRVIGETVAANVQAEAEIYVANLVPIGTPESSLPVCTARQYSTKPNGDSTFVVVVSYIYNQPAWDTTVWTIESDSYAEQEETDQQYDPTDSTQTRLIPIRVNNYILDWLTPQAGKPVVVATGLNEAPQPPAFGLVNCPRRRKRWTYTKQIYSRDDAIAYDNSTDQYVGRINSAIFTGVNQSGVEQNRTDPIGTILCMDAGLRYSPYAGQYIAYALMCFKPEGWQPWARWSNSVLGVPDNIWRAGVDPITGSPYDANGTVPTTTIPTADLNVLLTLI